MCLLLINNHNHTTLTMLASRAVKPHWLIILNSHSVRRHHLITGLNRHRARMHTSKVARESERNTRVVERRLCDSVCANTELELDHVAHWCLKLPWREGQLVLSRGRDLDDVDFDVGRGGSGCEDRGGEESCELHFELSLCIVETEVGMPRSFGRGWSNLDRCDCLK